MNRQMLNLLVVLLPAVLAAIAYALDSTGQCRPEATLGVVCEILGLGAVFAILPAVGVGIQSIFSKTTELRYKIATAVVLLVYIGWFVFYVFQ